MAGSSSDIIVGIDLGTTNSLVAYCDQQGPRVLVNERGERLVPSVVRYESTAGGESRAVVGSEARAAAGEFPATTISSVKRLMGRSVDDARADLPYFSFDVRAGERGTARLAIPTPSGERIVSPQEVSADILRTLREQASAALGAEVHRAVVTVPAYFDDAQRQATRESGRLAGLEVVRILNEPTAAALAYGLGLDRQSERNAAKEPVAVFDLGGGTFDVSILKILSAGGPAGEETSVFQVIATSGDTHLGGDDVDRLLVDYALDGRPVGSVAPGDMARLVASAEAAKRYLSQGDRAVIGVDQSEGPRVERSLDRGAFERLIEGWVERAITCCRRAMGDAARVLGMDGGSMRVGAVVMVGGSTRIPLVRRRVGEFFGLDPYVALDPDEVVALGASVQASILSGTTRGRLLLDVIPLSLGIETVGGAVAKLIMRNSAVPTRATEMFSTSVDGQTSIAIHILQGERELSQDCRSLGMFHVRGIAPMPAGIPQLQVEFAVDSNGVLSVSAVERRSGRRAAVQVIPNHGLTAEEVDRIERESVVHAREDMARHRVIDLVVNSRLDLKWIGDRMERFGHLVEADYLGQLREAAEALAAMVARAESDWRSVEAGEFYTAKEFLDRLSVRLQEVSITESLRVDPPGALPGGA
ncbi:MAG: Hsp70 family protein [Phycisphaeraceae bacterium]|nr:Hsp70 family protein [Phycisphaerae bacterium]MBX3393358.1 Hsp70 family protein [Phycisphaeraceae bacterium]